MRDVSKAGAGILGATACVFAASTALGAVQDTVNFTDAESTNRVGLSFNERIEVQVTGGYELDGIDFSGTLRALQSGTRGTHADAMITSPQGYGVIVDLGSNGTMSAGQTANASGTINDFNGLDPAGTWIFEFAESSVSFPTSDPDAIWDTITFEFNDGFVDPNDGDPDVTLCQLYDLRQFGRTGSVLGLSIATTSWNIGTKVLLWDDEPETFHPFIAMNLYRLDPNGRFMQIGQSWVKHGFFALSNQQCFDPAVGGCQGTNGTRLGIGCTDTYSSGLNASQGGLGPRYDINPWTGGWSFYGSVFDSVEGSAPSNNGIRRRLQVEENDINPALNSGAKWYYEGYYVCHDDVDVWNSAAWKPVSSISGSPGGTWNFNSSGSGTLPTWGFAVDAWFEAGATQTAVAEMQTVIAQEVPVVEFESPDGRSLLSVKAFDEGAGDTRFEYVLTNIDMDRQVGSITIPLDNDAVISDSGFYKVFHHDEPLNAKDGTPISNADWTFTRGDGFVRWETTDNPLRWGTQLNVWLTVDRTPVTDALATLGHYKSGPVSTVDGMTVGPEFVEAACPGDVDGNGATNTADITFAVSNLGAGAMGATGTPGDADGNGVTTTADITFIVSNLGCE
ncbi:MAG: hypothetical protein AAGD00_07035 [Planctomycetota bacterium]